MALDVLIGGANLDSASNVKVALSNTPANIGGIRNFSENDSGSVTLSPYLSSPETSQDYRHRVGIDTILFAETFNAAAQNTNNWTSANATMTATMSSGGTLNFGTVQGTANGHYASYRSYQYFPLIGTAPIAVEFSGGLFTATLVANEVVSFGLGVPGVAALPTDGAFFQITTAGVVGSVVYNGVTTSTAALQTLAAQSLATIYKYVMVVGEHTVEFWRDDILLGRLTVPAANGQPFMAGSLPIYAMKHCTGAVANTNTFRLSDITVSLLDIASNKPWAVQMATAGGSAYAGQNGHTQGSTTATGTITSGSSPNLPTSAAGSNTAANVTGLGGWGAINAAAGAATDFIATSYQNPAPTVLITGKNLVITGLRISTINTGAAVATTPTTLLWSAAYGHTAVSLATAEAAATHAPRRIQLGFQSAAIATAIGGLYSPDIFMPFASPIVVRPGEFFATVMKIVVGTATAAQTITYNVTPDGYFE